MEIFDLTQNNNRFRCNTIEYNGVRYLRIHKMYLHKDSGEWRFTPQAVMMNSECAEQFILAIHKIDVYDILEDLDK